MNFKEVLNNLFVAWPVTGYNKVVSVVPNFNWKYAGIGIAGLALLLLGVKFWPFGPATNNEVQVAVDVFGPQNTAIFTSGQYLSPRLGILPKSLVEIVVQDDYGFWISNPIKPTEQGAVAAFDDVCHIVFAVEGQKYRLTSATTRIKTRLGGPMSFEIGLHPNLNPDSQIVSGSGLLATTFADFKPGKVEFVVRQVDAFSPYSTAAQPILPATTSPSGGNVAGASPTFSLLPLPNRSNFSAAEKKVQEAAEKLADILEKNPPAIPQGVKNFWNNRFNQPIVRPTSRLLPSATTSTEFEATKLKFNEAKNRNNLAAMKAALAEMQAAVEVKSATN